jgi:hypothetical protein
METVPDKAALIRVSEAIVPFNTDKALYYPRKCLDFSNVFGLNELNLGHKLP